MGNYTVTLSCISINTIGLEINNHLLFMATVQCHVRLGAYGISNALSINFTVAALFLPSLPFPCDHALNGSLSPHIRTPALHAVTHPLTSSTNYASLRRLSDC